MVVSHKLELSVGLGTVVARLGYRKSMTYEIFERGIRARVSLQEGGDCRCINLCSLRKTGAFFLYL